MIACDFIPSEYHEARRRRSALHLRIGGIGCLIVVMGAWIAVHQADIAEAEAMLKELTTQREQVAIHLARKEQLISKRRALDERRLLLAQLGDAASLVVVFSEISRRQPKAVVLTDVRLNATVLSRYAATPEPAPRRASRHRAGVPDRETPERPAPVSQPRLTLVGVARDVPTMLRFAATMEESPLFDKILLDPMETTEWLDRKGERFEITCDLLPQRKVAS